MVRKHYNLPSLSALGAFEVAARKLSFKSAARELNVTPGAVSHQIKQLEQELGTPLFSRGHRSVSLTREGMVLFESLQSAFSAVSDSLSTIRKTNELPTVVVGATTAVSSLQLTAAISRFWLEHGDIAVNQIVSDASFSGYDRPDLEVRYGRDPDKSVHQVELFRDTLVPVCAPALWDQFQDMDLEELARSTLIHMEADNPKWTTWHDWFKVKGYAGPLASGIRVTNYMIALQTAAEGNGLVLGWKRLIAPMVSNGSLVPLESWQTEAPNRFYIVSKQEKQLNNAALTLKRWLVSNLFH